MKAVKRSRGAYTGVITKLKDKLILMQSKEISTYNVRLIERAQTSIANAEAGFQQTMEDAQEIMEEEEAESLESEEAEALDTFSEYAAEVQDLAKELLTLKRIHQGLRNLHCDATALRDSFDAQPELAHDKAAQVLDSGQDYSYHYSIHSYPRGV